MFLFVMLQIKHDDDVSVFLLPATVLRRETQNRSESSVQSLEMMTCFQMPIHVSSSGHHHSFPSIFTLRLLYFFFALKSISNVLHCHVQV